MSENPINKAYSEFESAVKKLGLPEQLLRSEPLKKYTTWRVGGPADFFVDVGTVDSMAALVKAAIAYKIPYYILGGGSNVLIGDKGFRGLVLKNSISSWELVDDPRLAQEWEDHITGESRHTAVHFHYYTDAGDPNYGAEQVFLKVSSGYSMASLIRETLDKGITGLEKFTRIPGTLGGWIYNNTHGHTQFIGDFIHEVRSLQPDGMIMTRSWKDLEFGYDMSIFHFNDEIILDAVLRLFKGDIGKAKEIAVEVMKSKMQRQPSNSGGCVFLNVTPDEKAKNDFESDAVGYIVDKQLGWLGTHKVGGAWISDKHGNFIETDGTATAADIIAVIDLVREECKKRYGVELREEIFRVGEF